MNEAREQIRGLVQHAANLSDEDSEVVMQRIADRLAGYTHEEVVEMHPLSWENNELS